MQLGILASFAGMEVCPSQTQCHSLGRLAAPVRLAAPPSVVRPVARLAMVVLSRPDTLFCQIQPIGMLGPSVVLPLRTCAYWLSSWHIFGVQSVLDSGRSSLDHHPHLEAFSHRGLVLSVRCPPVLVSWYLDRQEWDPDVPFDDARIVQCFQG